MSNFNLFFFKLIKILQVHLNIRLQVVFLMSLFINNSLQINNLLLISVTEMGLFLYTMVLLALFTILWKVSSVVRYYLKFIFFCLASMIGAAGPIPLMLSKPRDPKNAL